MGCSLVKSLQVLLALGMMTFFVGFSAQPAFADSAAASSASSSSSGSTSGGAEAEHSGTVADIDLNAPVPNYWPLPNGCKKMVPAGGEACDGCCRTTVNTWLSPWCWQHTQPGPQRDECHDDIVTWFTMCLAECAGTTSTQSGSSSQSNQ